MALPRHEAVQIRIEAPKEVREGKNMTKAPPSSSLYPFPSILYLLPSTPYPFHFSLLPFFTFTLLPSILLPSTLFLSTLHPPSKPYPLIPPVIYRFVEQCRVVTALTSTKMPSWTAKRTIKSSSFIPQRKMLR